MKKLSLILMLCCGLSTQAQLRNDDVYELPEMVQSELRTEIRIPGFDGYQTLKCDFHIHTVFSDGKVWPDVRAMEAWQEGLDAIAITDHIEYRPHKEILKGDLNESYKIAKAAGDPLGLIVIKGTEITRKKPLGHLNALFIRDANPMDVEDELAAVEEALRQEAFIMWNHPGWPDDKSTIYPIHEELLKAGKIHGVEIFNDIEFYPVSFDWFNEMNIAPIGNTDIHRPINIRYRGVRPMTLVFASERSENGIREALFAGRTAVFAHNQLVGKENLLKELVKACLKVQVINEKNVLVTNLSDISYEATSNGSLYILPAGMTIKMNMPATDATFTFENCFIAKDKKLTIPAYEFY